MLRWLGAQNKNIVSIADIIWPSKAISHQMFEELRGVCVLMTVVSSFAGVSLWIWDYTHDPVGAYDTVGLRLSIMLTALPYLVALLLRIDRHTALFCALLTFLGWEFSYLQTLERLSDSTRYGVEGFMYFIVMPLLMTRAFPFLANIALMAAIILFPASLVIAGFGPSLSLKEYFVLLLPASAMSLTALFGFTYAYRLGRHYRQALGQLALTDTLTGLGNRRRFAESLKSGVEEQRRLGLLTIDLDHFKQVNDTLGHTHGDELLRQVSQRFSDCVRHSDEVMRLGGDEFAIILKDLPQDDCPKTVAERVLEALSRPFQIAGHEIFVSGSIGIALYPDHGENIERLYERADAAMYAAKAGGRKRFEFVSPLPAPAAQGI